MQIKAGIKKEIIHFFRTGKLIGLVIAFIAFATAEPMLYKFVLSVSGNLFSEISEPSVSSGDVYANTSINSESIQIYFETDASEIFGLSLTDIFTTCLLIILLVFMATGGGELKKRSTTIPFSIGLKPGSYIIPKFIVYPVFILIISVIASFICAGTSIMMFPDSPSSPGIGTVMITGLSLGLYLIFNVCIFFTFGLCTKRAGLGVIIVYLSSTILNTVFIALKADKFHPYVLNSLVSTGKGLQSYDTSNILISAGITVCICAALFAVTLFVFNTSQIDNRSSQPFM